MTTKPNCSQCNTPRRPDDLRCRYCGAPFAAAPLIEGGEEPAARRPAPREAVTDEAPSDAANDRAQSVADSPPTASERPGATTQAGSAAAAQAVRPWPRFWARIIDLYVFGAVVTALLDYSNTGLLGSPTARQIGSVLALVAWMLIEARLLNALGTTTGKLLMNVRLRRRDGGPITTRDALLRCLRLWWRGLGAGLPIVSFITAGNAYLQLRQRGEASWDRDGGWVVEHGPIGLMRVLAALAVVIATFAMSVLVRIAA